METTTATIKLRPLRIGFLVNPSNRSRISDVLRYATTIWGGQICPLIPVSARLPKVWREPPGIPNSALDVAHGMIRFFEPDVLVETEAGLFDILGFDLNKRPMRVNRFCTWEKFTAEVASSNPQLGLGLNVSNVYHHLFLKEFQFKKRHDPVIVSFVEADKAATSFFEVCYGYFPKDEPLGYIEDDYAVAFNATRVAPSIDWWARFSRQEAGYPLFYTIRNIDLRYDGWQSPTIFIFDPLNPADVIDYWNCRQFVRDVLPVNVHWLEQSLDYVMEWTTSHSTLQGPQSQAPDVVIQIARSLNAPAIVDVLTSTPGLLDTKVAFKTFYDRIWHPTEKRISSPSRVTAWVNSQEVQLQTGSDPLRSLQIPVVRPDFPVFGTSDRPRWVNVIEPRTSVWQPDLADAVPPTGYMDDPGYPNHRIQNQYSSREGYVTFHDYPHESQFFGLPTRMEAIANWLYNRGITCEKSDAGRVADQLIESVNGLIGTALFRFPQIIEQLNKMAKSRKEWNDNSFDEYREKTAAVASWLKVLNSIKGKGIGWKSVTLDRLVKAGVLRLGLSINCSHCTKENWYSLDDVGSTLRCERCLKDYPYPQGEEQKSDRWKYRVIGPFATPHYAQGAYSVALTLRFLGLVFGSSSFTYSTSLNLTTSDGKILETDFFAWRSTGSRYRTGQEVETLVGECKSLGTEGFKVRDIERLKALSGKLPGAYIVATTLKSSLSISERKLLKNLATWGWRQTKKVGVPSRLIVLTGHEVFGDTPVKAWIADAGSDSDIARQYKHIDDLETLAEATQRAYLGFTDRQIAVLRYGKTWANRLLPSG